MLPNCPMCQIKRVLALLLSSLRDNACFFDGPIGLVLFLLAGPDLACVTVNLKKKKKKKKFWAELSYIVAHIWKKAVPLFSFSSHWTYSTKLKETRDTISGSFLWPAEKTREEIFLRSIFSSVRGFGVGCGGRQGVPGWNRNMCVFASWLDVVWVSDLQEMVHSVQQTGAS